MIEANRPIVPHVENETDRLELVVLGLPDSLGAVPELKDCYDAKSYETVAKGVYPTQEAIIHEMSQLREALERNGVQVLRPELIEGYNQVFARDVSFVIDDTLFVSNLIPDRGEETGAYGEIFSRIAPNALERLPEAVHTEGGDVLLYGDILFVGCYLREDYPSFKMARTNRYAIDFFKERFPKKDVLALELIKHDQNPRKGVLHLDCAFQPLGDSKVLLYPEGFLNSSDLGLINEIFKSDNVFTVTADEAYYMNTNIVSLSPRKIISDASFVRLNSYVQSVWGIEVETVPYQEISKMGGLLRCSTMPLIRRRD